MCVYYDFMAEGLGLFCRLAKLDFYLSGLVSVKEVGGVAAEEN